MKKDIIYDIVIVGGGPVGGYAGFYEGLRGLKGLIVEASNNVGGQAITLYKQKQVLDLPGHESITGEEVIKRLYKQYSKFKNQVKLQLNWASKSVVKKKKYLLLKSENNSIIKTKTICLAIGQGPISPIKLKIPNHDDLDITYNIDDIKNFYNKKVLIFGGGNSAIDWANELKDHANVSLIHRRSVFRANLANVKLLEKKVKIFTPYKIVNVTKKNVLLEETKTKIQKTLSYDKIIVQYGLRSFQGPIKDWELEWEKGKIKVNQWKQTSLDSVWAIGNSCYYEGKNYIITTGLADAIVAISSICKFLNPNVLTTFYSTDYKQKNE